MEQKECGELLLENLAALERFIRFRLSDRSDRQKADDLVQEVCVSVLSHCGELRNPEAFRPWLYRIARNRLNDVYREPVREISSDRMDELAAVNRSARLRERVAETLGKLSETDRELLLLCCRDGVPQKEAAARYGIPLGTLKSRLRAARKRFRSLYPDAPPTSRNQKEKSVKDMKQFPKTMPEYTIRPCSGEPFPVIHECVIGWGIVPRLGEKCRWASYDFPERSLTETMRMTVVGKAMIHGIEGVEIETVESGQEEPKNPVFPAMEVRRTLIAQLTDTHVRLLAEAHAENGVKKLYTFLDGSEFLDNWGYGEDNCGMETHLKPRGLLVKNGTELENRTDGSRAVIDVSGRFEVSLLGRTYDTVCLTDAESYDAGVLTETYLNRDGRIVLWRRFNRNDWHFDRFGQLWTERFPENERLTMNGETYVHWYDCLYDWIL